MYVKVTRSGPRRYVQLVESFRDEEGKVKQRTIATLGRLDQMDGALDSVIGGLMKVTGQEMPTRATPPSVTFESARALGDLWALQELWNSLGFSELALGSTLSVPTLEGKVGVRVPKGTADGRILRVRGRGVPKRSGGHGDLLVTVKVAVPPNLEGDALAALEAYAAAERASGFDPRSGWAGNRM